jgi:hypothetical protein
VAVAVLVLVQQFKALVDLVVEVLVMLALVLVLMEHQILVAVAAVDIASIQSLLVVVESL